MTKRTKVLIGYDGSESADEAIHDLKRAGLSPRAEALVVSVGEAPIVPPFASHEIIEKAFVGERVTSIVNHANNHSSEALSDARQLADAAKDLLQSHFPLWHVRAEVAGGRPANELIKKANEWNCHLLVVGSQGRSAVGRLLLGSVSLEVATHSRCSVRIGRDRSVRNSELDRRIIVGVNGFPGSERALEEVLKRRWPRDTQLRVIGVDDGHSQPEMKDGSASGVTSKVFPQAGEQGLRLAAELRRGDPAATLMAEAEEWEADCIFIAAGEERQAVNSVATELAMHASCSVEIVR